MKCEKYGLPTKSAKPPMPECKPPKSLTNADKIRGMSVHDMAWFIHLNMNMLFTVMGVMEWLQTEVEE